MAQQGLGPLTPQKPIQPVRGIESGAPGRGGGFPKLQPLGGMGALPAMAPMQPLDPQDAELDRLRNVQIDHVDTPSAPFNNPPMDATKSFKGWMKNFGDDIGNFVEGIPAMVKVAWENGKYISKNMDGVKLLYDHPEHLTKELDRVRTDVIKGVTDTYKDGLGEALYKHPFSVLMDATTIFDVVGGGVKVAGRAALTGAERAALRTGAEIGGSIGSKLLRLGDDIQRTPGRLFAAPFEATGRAALKVPVIKGIAENLSLTPYGMARKDKLASYLMNERVQAAQKSEDLWKNSIPKKDYDEYWELATGYKPMEHASKAELAEHATNWQKFNAHNEEWMKEFGIKNQAELDDAALKPLVERLAQDGIIKDPYRFENGKVVYNREALDTAKAWTEGANPHSLPTKPSYMPYYADRTGSLLETLENLKSEGQNLNTVKRFNKKGLGEGINRNPLEIQARATVQTAELRGLVNYVTDTIQNSGKIVKAGELPAGHVWMDPVLHKYIEKGLMPVHEAMISKYADEVTKGASTYDALKNAARHVDETMGEGLLKEARAAADDAANWGIAIPKEDAYLIESQLKGVSGPLRFYDKLMNTWRSTVLRLMPRYYMNNLLGNSILLMTGGHLPWSKTVADSKILPAEALSASGLLSEQGFSSDFISRIPGMKTVNKITDMLGDITDSKPRPLLVETKLREILKHDSEVGDVAANALIAQGSMDEAVITAMKARQESMQLGSQQAIMAKKVSLGLAEQKRLETLDAKMGQIQQQMRTERNLSNATPKDKILEKIGQNAPADEIHALHKQAELATTGGSTRLQELQSQLEQLGKQREATVGAYPYTRSAGGIGEDVQKLLDTSARRQALAPAAAKVEQAVSEMERFLGNYGRLHPLEREWVRRAIPFWTFVRTMNKLLFQLPFIAPKKAFLWNQYAKLMIDGANDDRLPARYRNSIPIGGGEGHDGQSYTIFMRVGGFNPFEAVQSTEMGGVKIPKLIDPSNNPFIKVLIETRGGYDTFTEKPFTEPTDFVALDGTVYRFDPKTNVLEPVIPQKPLISSLLNQIPHVKVIQEMLDGFSGTRDAAHNTRKDPEGNYIYDRSPLWAASRALGFPISVSDPEKVKTQHALLVRGMIKRFQAAGRRVDPETRDKLNHIVEDLGSGAFDLREW